MTYITSDNIMENCNGAIIKPCGTPYDEELRK